MHGRGGKENSMAKLKIADMEVGNTYESALAVVSATSRTTRAGKPYLVIELYDGVDKITCNYWDWSGENMPQTNTVYNFKVECSEYMGKKQLTCRKVKLNTTDPIEDFMPQGTVDVAHAYNDFYELFTNMEDDFYRELGLCICEEARGLLVHVPGAKAIHHAYMGGALVHSLSVGRLSKAMAEQIEGAWVDLATTGGLLHDVGKLFTYELDGLSINYTEDGQLLDHVFMGAEIVDNLAEQFIKDEFDEIKIRLLKHVILSHHQKLEYGSPVTPRCIEAWIVSHCDALDATCETIRAAASKVGNVRFTDKIWSAGNVQHYTPQAIAALKKKQHTVGIYDTLK